MRAHRCGVCLVRMNLLSQKTSDEDGHLDRPTLENVGVCFTSLSPDIVFMGEKLIRIRII